jgi:hypothetical protein
MLERATQWIALYPKAANTAEHTLGADQHLAGKKDNHASFYCNNAPELAKAARECNWGLATAAIGQQQTNGVAERR